MKICYLYLSSYSAVKSGVDNKVVGKCRELEKLFPGSRFIRFSTEIKKNEDDFFELVSFLARKKRFFSNYSYNKALFGTIDDFINKNKQMFTFFIFRYPTASFGLLKLLKSHSGIIIFEHNSNERVELKIRTEENKKKIPFSFRPSVLAYYLESIVFRSFIEKYIGKKCLELAAGGMVVTPEIGKLEKNIHPAYKTVVISNGIVPVEVKHFERKIEDVINGVFLAGTYAEWNGIERILKSYKKSKVKDKVHLYFVGRIDEHIKKEFINEKNPSVFFLDYINKAGLEKFMQKMHFAFGTCANQKRGIQEGAVLKVREALSAGLPIVNGHPDPYIQGIRELNKYCIYFPADDSDMDFDLINESIRSIYKEEGINTRIQQLSNKYLCWEEILKPLPSFLQRLKENSL
jgi:hypothetical protein